MARGSVKTFLRIHTRAYAAPMAGSAGITDVRFMPPLFEEARQAMRQILPLAAASFFAIGDVRSSSHNELFVIVTAETPHPLLRY
jgi:hypothetical protein